MMHFFLNSNEDFEQAAPLIFQALGVAKYLEGDSSNVMGGYYYSYAVFGTNIKLEQNSYDYEDRYKFMLTVKKDITSLTIDSAILNLIYEVIGKLLKSNLKMDIAVEDDNGLKEV